MLIGILKLFGILSIAIIVGKIVTKIKLPAILGWLITGIVFGPYLVGIISLEIMNEIWFKITIKCFECFAGVMIGREILIKQLAKSGKQIIGITFIQSIGTFIVVSSIFAVTFLITKTPIYIAFIFGGIALATAPAPALSIVKQYNTDGPVTKTLIPLAAIDDVIGVIVFFTVISIVGATKGEATTSIANIILMVTLPFIIGIAVGLLMPILIKKINNEIMIFAFFFFGLLICIAIGLVVDIYYFKSFSLNYLLIGMAYSASFANLIDSNKLQAIMKRFDGILNLSLIIVIVNLGMPLDYRLIAGASLFTAVYILSRALGKISGAYIGGKITRAEPTVTKYLGLTLLPHSGVSLIFTGIAVSTLTPIDPTLANIVSGTIVAAAIINEIIAVILAKFAFKWAGEIQN